MKIPKVYGIWKFGKNLVTINFLLDKTSRLDITVYTMILNRKERVWDEEVRISKSLISNFLGYHESRVIIIGFSGNAIDRRKRSDYEKEIRTKV